MKYLIIKITISILIAAQLPGYSFSQDKQIKSNKQLSVEFDRILSAQFKTAGTGCVALVARRGKVIYKKAFGMADLELNVPMRTEMIFRIGSMTKQFTAIAILQLMERGELSLTDDIKKFIPDYPTRGNTITIQNLLTHTSGIKDYASMNGFDRAIQMKDRTPAELIDFFKNEPMDFPAGTKFHYSNSNYTLLGYIIEKVSGKPYAQYIEENIFKPLNMGSAYYDVSKKVIKNRARGYGINNNTHENAPYISMTHPYADGGLMMSVDDYFKWTLGLHTYKLVNRETLEKAFQPFTLASGKISNYGFGWYVKDFQGSTLYRHNGGIDGFSSIGMYFPKEEVLVVAFSNCNCYEGYPLLAGSKIAALAINKPLDDFKKISLDSATLKGYEGVYENEPGEQNIVTSENNTLYFEETGDKKIDLTPFEKDKFFFDEVSSIKFKRGLSGKIEKMFISRPTDNSPTGSWTLTNKPIPTHKEIEVSETILNNYVGEYEFHPNVPLRITKENGHLFSQVGYGPKFELFAESGSKFFSKSGDVEIEFIKDDEGTVSKLILYQGPANIEMKKIK